MMNDHRKTSRRCLITTGAAALLQIGAGRLNAQQPPRPRENRFPMNLTPEQKARLNKALEGMDAQYDPAEKMIKRQVGPAYQYHTNLRSTVGHPTRESIGYAVALLDTGDPEREKRAFEVIQRILDLQDKDPEHAQFGIWGWYMEEPPIKMSPADWNWADFIGVQLLQIVLSHRSRLPDDLSRGIDEALKRATFSIRKRNVGPGYTNIAIMGTYVTLVTAEIYGDDDLKGYALDRLRKFHEFSKFHGAFNEYNSPTYTIVALEELARLREHVRTAEAKPLIEDIYRMAWEEIAHHFHAPTRQWAGPHSRAYSDLLPAGTLAFIERNTSDKVKFGVEQGRPSINEHRMHAPCPPDLESYFVLLPEPRTVVKTFIREERPTVGTTYLVSAFALGSVNRGDLWNQRRPLITYWGTVEKPSYVRIRFLHDGYDFAAVRFWSQQHEGDVLAGLALATDGGDKHPSIDRIKDATIQAKDLRIRFEFGGAAAAADLKAPVNLSAPATVTTGGVHVAIAVPYARWGETEGTWAAGTDGKTSFLDIVFYEGEEKTIKLSDLAEIAAGLAVRVGTSPAPLGDITARRDGDRLRLSWNDLALVTPVKPENGGALAAKAEV